MPIANALWIPQRSHVELRQTAFELIGDMIEVETLFSGISRGTERIVYQGVVPASEWQRMRCPLQEGDFRFPVKYGYAAVGVVRNGASDVHGRTVFVLHPHQDRFAAPTSMVHVVPEGVPPARAVLAANMETALNICWDSHASAGDRILVVGAGVVGLLVAWLFKQIPGTDVTIVDINVGRADIAAHLDCQFAAPEDATDKCDVVVHASASAAGLAMALRAAAIDGRVVEASWYGDREVGISLGEGFHSHRLQLISSQVGQLPVERRSRWTHGRRLQKALELLRDDRLDALISGETPFSKIAESYGSILSDPNTLCHRIRYSPES